MRALVICFALLAAGPTWATEAFVSDGDTLVLDGKIFRLDGIEAPQTDQTCLDESRAVWRCGVEARNALKAYLGSRSVRCDDAGPDAAYQKRRLAVCRVEGETGSLNQWLVREGWALVDTNWRFKADENDARFARKGLWKGCFVSPQLLRRYTRNVAKLLGAACPADDDWNVLSTLFPDYPTMPPGCSIKGKLAARALVSGNRGIYHMESCRSYQRTKKPERWFCSEEEARAEGFRKSYRC
jgi:endonuclease YncB( thermonuclease family)